MIHNGICTAICICPNLENFITQRMNLNILKKKFNGSRDPKIKCRLWQKVSDCVWSMGTTLPNGWRGKGPWLKSVWSWVAAVRLAGRRECAEARFCTTTAHTTGVKQGSGWWAAGSRALGVAALGCLKQGEATQMIHVVIDRNHSQSVQDQLNTETSG